MRLDTFFLADSVAAFGGQFYVHGGGITRITPPFLPWDQPQLAFLVRFQMEEGETSPPTMTVTTYKPSGGVDGGPLEFAMPEDASPSGIPGEELFLEAAVNPGPYTFEEEGVYRFELSLGDEVVRELHLAVVVQEPE